MNPPNIERLARVRLFAVDVDGTLTDGTVYYDDANREIKGFHTQDGLGIVLAGFVGLKIAWITGRSSTIVERRAKEISMNLLRQGVRDKAEALRQIAAQTQTPLDETAYMGDDLNDLPAMQIAGAALAPANAVPELLKMAHLVTQRPGGAGAVREGIEAILNARGEYATALAAYLHSITTP